MVELVDANNTIEFDEDCLRLLAGSQTLVSIDFKTPEKSYSLYPGLDFTSQPKKKIFVIDLYDL